MPGSKGIGFPVVSKKSIESIQVEETKSVNVGEINRCNGFGLLEICFCSAAYWCDQPGNCKAVGKGCFSRKNSVEIIELNTSSDAVFQLDSTFADIPVSQGKIGGNSNSAAAHQ